MLLSRTFAECPPVIGLKPWKEKVLLLGLDPLSTFKPEPELCPMRDIPGEILKPSTKPCNVPDKLPDVTKTYDFIFP